MSTTIALVVMFALLLIGGAYVVLRSQAAIAAASKRSPWEAIGGLAGSNIEKGFSGLTGIKF